MREQGVYVIKHTSGGRRYVGLTCNLDQRMSQHNGWEVDEFIPESDREERKYIESEKIGILMDSGEDVANTYKTNKRRRNVR